MVMMTLLCMFCVRLLRPRRLALAALVTGAMASGGVKDVAADTLELPTVEFAEVGPETVPVAVRGLPSVAEPLWTDYALTEALFWGRDNQAANRPLVVGEQSGATIVSVRDLQFPVAAGVRSFYGRRNPNEGGWEIGYFGVYGMSASDFVTAPADEFLQMAPPLGDNLTDQGETARLKYNSLVNSAEANLFRTWQEWRPSSGSWLTVDWLAGFRYIGVEETAAIEMNCCVIDEVEVPYRVRSRNNMFGGQVGSRARWTWNRWALEGWAKVGLLGNAQMQSQDALIDYAGEPVRSARSSLGSEVGFVGDLNLSAVYRLNDVWGIRAGYSTVWITGLALAPNQFDFALADGAGTGLAGGGGMFLNGANLGLEARW